MIYDLPKTVNVSGEEYAIRSDYREILDICLALNDFEISEQERTYSALDAFYPDFESIPTQDYNEAVEAMLWFINCGEEPEAKKSIQLVDWEKDFPLIVAAINKNHYCGDIRAQEYYHWWTFIADYKEKIGDCTFAQVVSIRDKKARGKTLDKSEREWYMKNRKLVDIERKYTTAEDRLVQKWT